MWALDKDKDKDKVYCNFLPKNSYSLVSPFKSKYVAFLYQHQGKLGVHLKSKIKQLMQEQTDNEYWCLGEKQLKRYTTPNPKPKVSF